MELQSRPIRIEDLDLPDLKPYRTLRRPLDHEKQGIFVAEGATVVLRLLQSGWPVVSMLMTSDWLARLESENANVLAPVYVAEKPLLETIIGYRLHQGIMAVARIPEEPEPDSWIDALPRNHLLVALDGVVHAENVGVIVRNCSGFGVDGIVCGDNSSSPFLRRAVRNSMGGVFRVPIIHAGDLCRFLERLHSSCGTRIVIADPSAAAEVYDFNFAGSVCLVVGNEGSGVTNAVRQISHDSVAIPMLRGTDSLNVSNACAVLLYEARRQRRNG